MFGWTAPNHSSRKSSKSSAVIRSTRSFIYFPDQTLGDGATSAVYVGRNKKSGDKVAVKVFNAASFHRPGEVQDREFEVLQKLKHENIVRLLSIEEESGTKQRVLVMELCDCSVLNMLEKVEYYFGFQEEEFFDILKDITAGLKYLQDVDIVHRDIKPGNIMKRIGPDKRPVFKLADFGAARTLEDGEQFQSLYGTEEYLHPDMYGRALLRKAPNNPFTSTVDLWSLGVTLYHIATGILPFRPFGGRKNKKTMYEMTTQKPTGAIAAIQKRSERGPIEYNTELPSDCHLPDGLKHLLTPMLAGLLECNPDKMWPFQSYFACTQRIFTMKNLDVFLIEKSQLLKIYMEPEFTLAEVQEQIAAQTDIPADLQILAYDGRLFLPEASMKCEKYPETSESSPLLLWRRDFEVGASLEPILPDACPMADAAEKYNLEGDCRAAKACVAVTIVMANSQRLYFTLNDLYTLAVRTISAIAKSHITELKYHHAHNKGMRSSIEALLQGRRREVASVLRLFEGYLEQTNGNKADFEALRDVLVSVGDEISSYDETFQQIETRFQTVDGLLHELTPYLEHQYLITTWDPGQGCDKTDRCSQRLDVFLEEIDSIYEQFRQDKKRGHLEYNDEQIHKMAKHKLRQATCQVSSLVDDHCRKNLMKSNESFTRWFLSVSEVRAKINDLDTQMTPLATQLKELHDTLGQEAAQWTLRIDSSVSDLSSLLKKPAKTNLMIPPCDPNKETFVDDAQLKTESFTNGIKSICSATIDDFGNTTPSIPARVRMISVSRSLKNGINYTDSESTKATILQSRQLLDKFESLSLSIDDIELSDIELSENGSDEELESNARG